MATQFVMTTIVVKDYDEAINFYVNKVGFILVEDTTLTDQKRWVVVASDKLDGGKILLAKAADESQSTSIGNQTGGRVAFFLNTDNFESDYKALLANGLSFVRLPVKQSYGTVAVFEDLYGNLWDLIGPNE